MKILRVTAQLKWFSLQGMFPLPAHFTLFYFILLYVCIAFVKRKISIFRKNFIAVRSELKDISNVKNSQLPNTRHSQEGEERDLPQLSGRNRRQWEKRGTYSHCGGLKGAKNKPQIIQRLTSQVPTKKESDSEICNIKNRGFPASSTSQPSSHSLKHAQQPCLAPAACSVWESLSPSVLTSSVHLRSPWSDTRRRALCNHYSNPMERQPHVACTSGKLPNSFYATCIFLL